MADGILAAVNENGNIDRFIDTKGGVHYIEPKRYEESVAKIDAAATKAKETVNSATEAVSECKAQTGACTQETARAKEIADTVESRITGIEGDIAALRDSVSQTIDAIESQAFSDIEVSAQMRSGIVCVNVCRLKNDSVKALTKCNSPIVIGKIKQEYWPSHNYVQYIGTQNSAWLIMSVNKQGEVAMFHQHVPSDLYWNYFEGSLSYPIA